MIIFKLRVFQDIVWIAEWETQHFNFNFRREVEVKCFDFNLKPSIYNQGYNTRTCLIFRFHKLPVLTQQYRGCIQQSQHHNTLLFLAKFNAKIIPVCVLCTYPCLCSVNLCTCVWRGEQGHITADCDHLGSNRRINQFY